VDPLRRKKLAAFAARVGAGALIRRPRRFGALAFLAAVGAVLQGLTRANLIATVLAGADRRLGVGIHHRAFGLDRLAGEGSAILLRKDRFGEAAAGVPVTATFSKEHLALSLGLKAPPAHSDPIFVHEEPPKK
jgi:hypothetical protein